MERARQILFYPDLPSPRTVISKVCKRLGLRASTAIDDDYHFGFKWRDSTWHALDEDIESFIRRRPLYNAKCTDISKRRLEVVFAGIFGYDLAVDPLRAVGPIVCKSNRNAAHDGIIVNAPIPAPYPDSVYERLIDNCLGQQVVDLRLPILMRETPFVYIKRRPISSRFSNHNSRVDLGAIEAFFSREEHERLLAYCAEIGMEYGELDILRDQRSDLLYIVDANNTPYGPPNGITPSDGDRALELLCLAFEQAFGAGS